MMRSAIPYHPVCANKEREHFLSGAATPPKLGGEFGLTFRYMTYLWAKRELEDIDALLLTKSSGNVQTPVAGFSPRRLLTIGSDLLNWRHCLPSKNCMKGIVKC